MMRLIAMLAVLVAATTAAVSHADEQTTDEVKRLKAENDLLRKQMKILEKENELLKREIELMKKEAKSKPGGGSGTRPGQKSRTKGVERISGIDVEYELLKCVRNRKERTRVTFTFAVRCERGKVDNVGICKKLNLITSDGKALDGRVVSGPKDVVALTKGEWSKFQVTYEGVDEDITDFDEVGLAMGGPIGIPRLAVQFYRIKIEPK